MEGEWLFSRESGLIYPDFVEKNYEARKKISAVVKC